MTPITPQRLSQDFPSKLARPVSFRPPPFRRVRLANGLNIILAECHAVPLVQLSCVMSAGAQYDPPTLGGLASLVTPMLRDGTKTRSANQIAEEAEELGANIVTRVDWETSSLTIELLASDLNFGIDLLFDLFTSPNFPESIVESTRRRQIAKVRRQHWQPANLANEWFAHAIYGDSIYGRPILGTKTSLTRIRREHLVKFHQTHFEPNNLALVGVGSFHAEQLARDLESVFSATFKGRLLEQPFINPSAISATRIYLINLPHAAQTEIRIGHVGIPQNHPEFSHLQLLSEILSQRLNFNLRESKGYTYHVSSYFTARSGPGPFVIVAGVSNSNVGTAVREIVSEMERLQQEPVSEAEIIKTQNRITGTFLRSFQSNPELAVRLKQLLINNLPDEYFRCYMNKVWSVNRTDIMNLARSYLHPHLMAIVAAGPARQLRQQLAGSSELIKIDHAAEEI